MSISVLLLEVLHSLWMIYAVIFSKLWHPPPHRSPNEHIHPECSAVALSCRQPHGDAPCVWRAEIMVNTTIQPPLWGGDELLSVKKNCAVPTDTSGILKIACLRVCVELISQTCFCLVHPWESNKKTFQRNKRERSALLPVYLKSVCEEESNTKWKKRRKLLAALHRAGTVNTWVSLSNSKIWLIWWFTIVCIENSYSSTRRIEAAVVSIYLPQVLPLRTEQECMK